MAVAVAVGGPTEFESDARTAFFIFSAAEVALAGCMLLLMLGVCGYVVRCRRRGRQLCVPRASLGTLGILWVLSTFFSHVAIWDVLHALGVISVRTLADEMEIVCMTTTALSLGLVEPALLLLAAEVIRLKTASTAGRQRCGLPRWSFGRRAIALALPFALLQAMMMGVSTVTEMNAIIFRPQPGLARALSPSAPPAPPFAPPAPPFGPGISFLTEPGSGMDVFGDLDPSAAEEFEPTSPTEYFQWWHAEGCAVSIGSLAVSACFILPFEFFWTIWCVFI